jgi:hypothetical protein
MSNQGYESNAANKGISTGNAALAKLQRAQRNANVLIGQGKVDLAAAKLAEAQATYNTTIRRPSAARATRSKASTPPNKVSFLKAFGELPFSRQNAVKASNNYKFVEPRISEIETLLQSKNVSPADKTRYRDELGVIYSQLMDLVKAGGRRRLRHTRRRR